MQTHAHTRWNNARFASDSKQESGGNLGGCALPEILNEETGAFVCMSLLEEWFVPSLEVTIFL